MRPYVRPLIVTSSALGLACVISYAALTLTEPEQARPVTQAAEPAAGAAKPSREAKAAAVFAKAKREAAGGDPQKVTTLANCHLYGIGTEKNQVEATRLHRSAAEKKHPFAMYMYGSALRLGIGVQKDVVAGVAMIRAAAETGLPEAEYEMYELLTAGEDIKADHAAARKWQLMAAEHGYHSARADLAEEIIDAKDTKRFKSVVSWVRDGAMAGHDRCAHIMSFVYEQGLGTPIDPVESMAWRLISLNASDELDPKVFREDYDTLTEEQRELAESRARELSGQREYASPYARDPAEVAADLKEFTETKLKAEKGDAEAQHRLAGLLDTGRGTKKDAAEAAKWCRRSAEQGYAEAQYSLAQTLRLGDGVAPDMKEAFQWYLKAARQGHVDSEHSLSVCYQVGDGVAADADEAKKWRRQAAEHGSPRSQCNLGSDYFGENPDLANDAIAARWFRKAAEQLHPKGVFCLGLCYISGRGVPQDRIEGLAWMFTRAKDMDSEQLQSLQDLLADFSEDEIKQANKRGREIFEHHLRRLQAADEKK